MFNSKICDSTDTFYALFGIYEKGQGGEYNPNNILPKWELLSVDNIIIVQTLSFFRQVGNLDLVWIGRNHMETYDFRVGDLRKYLQSPNLHIPIRKKFIWVSTSLIFFFFTQNWNWQSIIIIIIWSLLLRLHDKVNIAI